MGSLRGPVEPGQGCCIVSYWTLNNIMDDMVLTSGYAEDLRNVRLRVWGQQGRRQGGRGVRGPAKLIAVARGLWVGLQASAKHM